MSGATGRRVQSVPHRRPEPAADKQISTVTTLMRISATKEEFKVPFTRAFPGPQQRLALVLPRPEEDEVESA